MGQSANLNIAKNKAELEARRALAQQVETNLKVVSETYANEMVGNQAAEAVEMFETLAREVTNTTIGDIRQLDVRQLGDKTYKVHVAIEVKKKRAQNSFGQRPKTTPRFRTRAPKWSWFSTRKSSASRPRNNFIRLSQIESSFKFFQKFLQFGGNHRSTIRCLLIELKIGLVIVFSLVK